MAAKNNVIIIGGGHNGLITAFYLARAGHRPLLLEARPTVGGCATTEEFHPGFKCSALAHTCGPLADSVAKDMQLESHGLQMMVPAVNVFAPSPDGRPLLLAADHAESARSIEAFSPRDAGKYLELATLLERYGRFLQQLLILTPPSIDAPSSEDLWKLLQAGRGFRSLGKKDMMRLLRYGPMAVADLAAEFFQTELLRAVIAARGIFGAAMGPWSAGSAAQLLLRTAFDPHPAGSAAFPRGGMGALAEAMAGAAKQAGAEIRTGAVVEKITAKDGAVTGVVLVGGEEIAARAVVSNADPRRTFLNLMDPAHLPPDFILKMQHFRGAGTVAKVNLALDGLPTFTALRAASTADGKNPLAGRIHIAPEIDYLERAFDESKYGDFSKQPYLDICIPSVSDSTLAPAGKHVMSVCMQFAPYRLKQGDWNGRRNELAETVVKKIAEYAPDLPGKILGAQVITPADLEANYGLTGGHIFHGELALDQLFTMRPVLGWARYGTPLRGLYLCGSGTHPGTGLNGLCGANAAREIVKDLRRK